MCLDIYAFLYNELLISGTAHKNHHKFKEVTQPYTHILSPFKPGFNKSQYNQLDSYTKTGHPPLTNKY